MSQIEFKKGQQVKATTAKGESLAGVVTQLIPGQRGSFVEVKHAGDKVSRYRPSKVALA